MSAPAGQKQLRAAIDTRTFAPVYLFHGDDEFRKNEAVRQLVDSAVDPATRDFNLEIRRAAETDAETLGALLGTPPMMADRRAVVLRDVPSLKKDARTTLGRYLARPATDTVLVLVVPAGAKVDKDLADRTEAIEFAPLSGAQLPKWIANYAQQHLGATITPEAVSLLQESAGTDLPSLAIELEKLGSYSRQGTIDEAAVAAVVGVQRGETLADLLDAVANRDARAAMSILPVVLDQPKTTCVFVVMALTAQTLGLSYARGRLAKRLPPAALRNELFGFLKSMPSAPLGRAWGGAVEAWARSVDRWSAADCESALSALLAADAALKGSRVSTDDQVMASLILSLCAASTRRAA